MDPNTTQPQEQNAPVTEISQTVNSILKNEQTAPNPETVLPQPVNSQPQEPVKKKSSILTIAVILLIIAVLALAGYILWSKYFNKVAPVQTPTPVAVVTPTATPDPTADWLIYLNTNAGYSFKYPVAWKAETNYYNQSNSLFGPEATNKEGIGGVEIIKSNLSVEEYLSGVDMKIVSSKDMNIGDHMGLRITSTSSSLTSGGESFLFKSNDNIIVNIYINSSDDDILTIFDNILPTFKFNDASPSSIAE